jgi:hypothetical protein
MNNGGYDEDDDQQDGDQDDDTDDQTQDADDSQPNAPQGAANPIAGAAPQEVDAHRSMLSEVFQTLEGQGTDTSALAAQAGASTDDPAQMSHSDLLNTTLTLAREHPEVVQEISQRFPEAQGILGMVMNSGSSQGGGGLLGSILGRL